MAEPVSLPANALRTAIADAVSTRRLSGSTVLERLGELASDCIDSNDDGQAAVAYALACFCYQMAEEHENSQMLDSYTVSFVSAVSEPINRAATFINDGGSADQAVAIIAAISRIRAALPPQNPS